MLSQLNHLNQVLKFSHLEVELIQQKSYDIQITNDTINEYVYVEEIQRADLNSMMIRFVCFVCYLLDENEEVIVNVLVFVSMIVV